MRHNKKIIVKLKELRGQGWSIPELMKKTGLPKTTIWHHVHDVTMPSEKSALIRSRQGASKQRSEKAWQDAKCVAEQILRSNNRELAIKIAMLYWAEGHKRALVFTNTDPDMLRLYISFLTEVLHVSLYDIKAFIRITTKINKTAAVVYWQSELGLSQQNITTNKNDLQNKTRTQFGICRITVVKSANYHKIVQSLIQKTRKLS